MSPSSTPARARVCTTVMDFVTDFNNPRTTAIVKGFVVGALTEAQAAAMAEFYSAPLEMIKEDCARLIARGSTLWLSEQGELYLRRRP